MDPIVNELLKQGILGIVIAGLLYAIKVIRAEHTEREKLWKGILDEQSKKNDLLQAENLATLKDDIKSRALIDAKLADIIERLPSKGG